MSSNQQIQVVRRGVHLFAFDKGFPPRIPLFRVLIRQACWNIGWHGGFPSFKGSLHSGKQTGMVKFKGPGNQPKVIEIFEPTISDS